MRDLFYGDDRDLVKWGVLLKLAEQFSARRILQVAYFRHEGGWTPLEIDGQECPMPSEIIRHFRDVRDIRRLNCPGLLRVHIDVLDAPFSHRERDAYLERVFAAMSASAQRPCVVFLDPDTGIGRKGEHVLPAELLAVWGRMRARDLLVFYQHAIRDKRWLETRRRQFEEAIGLPVGSSRIARGGIKPSGNRKRFCSDVAFFFAQKSPARECSAD